MPNKSKISTFEWCLVLGVALTLDLIQFFLDAYVIGIVVNRFIDICIGMALPLYLKLRGIKLNAKRVGGILLSFFFEMIPLVDGLPLWSADIIYTWVTVRADDKLAATQKPPQNLPRPRFKPETYTHEDEQEAA